MARVEDFAIDPSILPGLRETKGSVLLRSNHMKYKRGIMISNWDKDRETLPMDYDLSTCEQKDWNLSKSAYDRLGTMTDGSMKDVHSTTHDFLEEAGRLKPDHETQEIYKSMVTYDNFHQFPLNRDTGRPERGYGSVLPRHHPDHRKAYMITTHSVDYKYPYEWTPTDFAEEVGELPQHHRARSELAENDGPKRRGINTFRDCSGSVDY